MCIFRCDKCGEGFIQNEGLKRHVLRHKINEGTLTEEEKRQIEEQKRPCELCGQKFLDPGALKRHLKSHAGIKDFVCGTCGKTYGSKRAMDLHISVIHLGEKNFPCKECGKQFGRYTTLRVHMLSHTGERPFQVCKILNDGKTLTPNICSATFATLVSRRRETYRTTSQSLIPTALCSRRRTNLLRRIMATPRPTKNMKNHYSYQVIVHSPCYRLHQISIVPFKIVPDQLHSFDLNASPDGRGKPSIRGLSTRV